MLILCLSYFITTLLLKTWVLRSKTSFLKSFILLRTLIRNWKVIWCLRKMLFGSEMMIKKFTMCIGLAINLMLLYLNWNIIQLSRRKNFWCHSIEYKPALKLWPITLWPKSWWIRILRPIFWEYIFLSLIVQKSKSKFKIVRKIISNFSWMFLNPNIRIHIFGLDCWIPCNLI